MFNDYFHSISDSHESNYYSIENFSNTFKDLNDSIVLFNYSIRSFRANFDDFEGLLSSFNTKLNLIVLTETRFAADISGYIMVSTRVELVDPGGRVSIYCDVTINAFKVPRLSFVRDNLELCVVEINNSSRKIIIIGVYRRPDGRVDNFIDLLLTVLNDDTMKNSEILIAGDLNIDLADYENSPNDVKNFVNIILSHSFLSAISRPTRFPSGEQARNSIHFRP